MTCTRTRTLTATEAYENRRGGIPKASSEVMDFDFDFSGLLAPGEVVLSATIEADAGHGLAFGGPALEGGVAQFEIGAGNPGEWMVRATVVTSFGQTLVLDGLVVVYQ